MESSSSFVNGWDNKNITWNCCGKYLSTAEAVTTCHDDDHNNGIYAIQQQWNW